jgi:hypothetical protein
VVCLLAETPRRCDTLDNINEDHSSEVEWL